MSHRVPHLDADHLCRCGCEECVKRVDGSCTCSWCACRRLGECQGTNGTCTLCRPQGASSTATPATYDDLRAHLATEHGANTTHMTIAESWFVHQLDHEVLTDPHRPGVAS